MKQSFWSFLQLVLHLRSWYCVYGWWVVRLNAWCQYEHCLRLEIRAKLTTFIFLLISLLVFTAVFYAISHLKEREIGSLKNIHYSPYIQQFFKKIQKWKNLHSWCKENQDGRHLVQNKVSLQGMFKNESVALFLGQLQVKFPSKEANSAFFRYYF